MGLNASFEIPPLFSVDSVSVQGTAGRKVDGSTKAISDISVEFRTIELVRNAVFKLQILHGIHPLFGFSAFSNWTRHLQHIVWLHLCERTGRWDVRFSSSVGYCDESVSNFSQQMSHRSR